MLHHHQLYGPSGDDKAQSTSAVGLKAAEKKKRGYRVCSSGYAATDTS
jgi:hypothetical protein